VDFVYKQTLNQLFPCHTRLLLRCIKDLVSLSPTHNPELIDQPVEHMPASRPDNCSSIATEMSTHDSCSG
jgi:hypothetical protein